MLGFGRALTVYPQIGIVTRAKMIRRYHIPQALETVSKLGYSENLDHEVTKTRRHNQTYWVFDHSCHWVLVSSWLKLSE